MRPACVVLSGGEGRRMGGSKPLRRLGGATLIANALELARGYGAPVAVAVRNAEQVGDVGAQLLIDDPSIAGPLAGLASAQAYAAQVGAARVLTIPCDMPRLPPDLAARLGAALNASPRSMVAVAATAGRLHPVCALWRREALELLRPYAAAGWSSLKGFASACGCTVVRWAAEEGDPFANANTPDELAALQPLASGFVFYLRAAYSAGAGCARADAGEGAASAVGRFISQSTAITKAPAENTTSPGSRIHCQNRVWS